MTHGTEHRGDGLLDRFADRQAAHAEFVEAVSGVSDSGRVDPVLDGVSVTLPWPPAKLTPNAKRRTHWRVYQPVAKQYRWDCYMLTAAALIGKPRAGLRILSVTFCPPDRRKRDDDGMIGAFKAGRDGVADALGVDDHTFRPSYHFADPVKGGAVSITIGGSQA